MYNEVITQRRSVAKNIGCFGGICLWVCGRVCVSTW